MGPPYFNGPTYAGLFDLTTMSYVVGLIEHPEPVPGRFDERRVGLDHFGLQAPERSDLDEWSAHLHALEIPHSKILQAPYAHVINFRAPDGIALELSVTNLEFWMPLVMGAASPD